MGNIDFYITLEIIRNIPSKENLLEERSTLSIKEIYNSVYREVCTHYDTITDHYVLPFSLFTIYIQLVQS